MSYYNKVTVIIIYFVSSEVKGLNLIDLLAIGIFFSREICFPDSLEIQILP